MITWKSLAVESIAPAPDEVVVVLGVEGIPSGELPGGRYAVLRHRILASLKDQKEERTRSPEWIEADGVRALAVGIADKPGLDADDRLRIACNDALQLAAQRSPARAFFLVDAIPPARQRLALEGCWFGGYRFDRYKSKPSPAQPELILCVRADSAVLSGSILANAAIELESTDWVRDAVNEPGSSLPPRAFASRAEALAKENSLKWRAWGRKELEKEGCQGLITVGKGSDHEPVLGVLEYRPSKASGNTHLVLVGKGVTFDTGGISIKPAERMWEMKNDMAGAATVIGAVAAIARLGLPVRVSAVVCLAENRPGNASVLPGDVFKARNGKTVMVENTDAEGRLVLSDGLHEAGLLGATHVVDLATLTGAVVRALGSSIAGLFASDEEFGELVRMAGQAHGEKLWPLPLDMEYRSKIDDPVADMRNSGGPEAGATTAALFLQEFAPKGVPWVHLDIAGTAFATKTWKYWTEGATAFGSRTLVELARRLAQ
jgi:leucyl aminopeptidase